MWRLNQSWMLLLLFIGLILPALAEQPSSAAAAAAEPSETPGIPILNQTLPNRLMNVGKSYLTGKRITVDYVQRKLDDAEAGVVRLTDGNYHETVEEGNKDDIYVVILHGDMTHRNSPKYHDAHTEATKLYREAMEESKKFKDPKDSETTKKPLTKDEKELLKHVKWGRIDYVDEWKTCARWQIFRPPYLVIITDAGKSLRFFSSRQFPPKGDVIFDFIKSGQWKNVPEYKGWLGPGGKLSFLAEAYIKPQERFSERFGGIPPIVWMLVFGWMTRELTTITTNWFNSRDAKRAEAKAKETIANPRSKESVKEMERKLRALREKRGAAASGSTPATPAAAAASGSKASGSGSKAKKE